MEGERGNQSRSRRAQALSPTGKTSADGISAGAVDHFEKHRTRYGFACWTATNPISVGWRARQTHHPAPGNDTRHVFLSVRRGADGKGPAETEPIVCWRWRSFRYPLKTYWKTSRKMDLSCDSICNSRQIVVRRYHHTLAALAPRILGGLASSYPNIFQCLRR